MRSARVLVTGGAGYIFANFIRHTLQAEPDWTIVALDRLDEAGSQERLSALKQAYPGRLHVVWHDLRAAINPLHHPQLNQTFDYIIHGAAMSHVDRAIKDPPGAVLDNVLGTAHLLEYVRHHQRLAKTIVFSTDEIFGPAADGVSFDEHARWEPENAYAATKAGAEALCPAYAHQYGLRIQVSHCANVYGGTTIGQYREKFIPLCAERILSGAVVQIHARDGVPASRLYIHVDDVSRAVLTILNRGGYIADDRSGRYNIVPEHEWSNLVVAEKIAAILGRPLHYELVENPPGRPRPDMRYALTGEKLRRLGWAPRVDFDAGLRETVESIRTSLAA